MHRTVISKGRVAAGMGGLIAFCLWLIMTLSLMGVPARAEALKGLETRTLTDGWRFRIAEGDPNRAAHPEVTNWMPATVPGTVQSDLIASGKLKDPYVGLNEAAAQWVGLSDWEYETSFTLDEATLKRGHIDLVFDGLDTFAEVTLNGKALLSTDNMFRTWRVPVKDMVVNGANRLHIRFASPINKMRPFMQGLSYYQPGAYDSAFGDEPLGQNSSAYVRKAGYQYGWDWGPRIVTLGPWRPVRLDIYDGVRLSDFFAQQQHLDDQVAALEARFEIVADSARNATLEVTVTDPDGKTQSQTQTLPLYAGSNSLSLPVRIDDPKRWWPVGYGRPDRYTVRARVLSDGVVMGERIHRIGLRTSEIRRQKDEWGRSFDILINGVPIYMKGANMIPLDMMPPRVSDAYRDRILKTAIDANMNMLRLWGGGHYFDDGFYDWADAHGLMLWQDFMFGGSIPPYDEAYRENVRHEAYDQVRRLRHHPSIVIWGGNNEVQVNWDNWGDSQALKDKVGRKEAERIHTGLVRLFDQVLRGAVDKYSPGVPYWPGSPTADYDGPSDGDRDGDRHYWTVWGGKQPVETYLTVTPRFMSEYGLQSFPVMATIKAFAGPKDMAIDAPVMIAHQKFDKGRGNQRLLMYINNNYGQPKRFEDFVYLSQVMQAEGIELAARHLRASRPQNMGGLYWQLNDVWPVASWSSVDYYGRWKALHYSARRFYAPVSVSLLRRDGVTELSVVSDRQSEARLHWRLKVMTLDGKLLSQWTQDLNATPLSAQVVMRLSDAELLKGADPKSTVVSVELLENDQVISRHQSYFVASKALALSDPKIKSRLTRTADGYRLSLSARTLARQVWVDTDALEVSLSDNAFDLMPGETITLDLKTSASEAQLRRALTIRSLYGAAQ